MRRLVRREMKFELNHYEVKAVREYIANFCQPDPYAIENGCYRVHSIYFDDCSLKSYQEKFEGNYFKRKYRLRYYNEDLSTLVGEIKTKYGDISEKNIIPIDSQNIETLESLFHLKNNSFVNEIVEYHLRPVMHVSYEREAYICKSFENIRITFDKDFKYQINPYSLREKYLKKYLLPYYIMEVKFYEENYWLSNLLADLGRAYASNFAPPSKIVSK